LRLAIFSDVHGNYINLVSFFRVTESLNIDQYVCLGDLCNYYPDNKKVIELIEQKKVTCLLGNHDEFYTKDTLLSPVRKLAYNFDDSLKDSDIHVSYLKTLPDYYRITIGELSILFCHGSPHNYTNGYVYPDTDLNSFSNISDHFIFMGHTHRQFLRNSKGKVFCNVGSIGQPRDNGALLGFAIFDTTDLSIMLYRKKADVEQLKLNYQRITPDEVMAMLEREEPINFKYTLI
jgi:putative phosphoesterase